MALGVTALVGETFVLTVSNVVDALGNAANRAMAGTILPMESRIFGTPGSDPREIGSSVPFGPGTFVEMVGGSAIWDNSDRGRFTYEARTGDFDLRVRLESLATVGSWTQAGLMARESTNANARNVYVSVQYGTGYNRYTAIYRQATAGSSAYWPGTPTTVAVPVPVPHAWMRLKREGDVFIAFRGTNGVDWIEYARITNMLPQTLLVGLATSANNNSAGQATTAVYQDYGDVSPSILSQPQSQSVASGANVTFGVTARGLPVLAYQWQLNGIPLPGETNSSLTLLGVTTNRVGSYRVLVSNPYGTAISQEAQLIVDGVGLGGFEADVSPAPLGNNAVTVSDWVKVGRLVVGLDVPLNSSEFARADCAPRTHALLGTLPLGDGRLSVADWTQAGRYAAAVDPLTPAGGPMEPTTGFAPKLVGTRSTASLEKKWDGVETVPPTLVRVVGRRAALGQPAWVAVELQAAGDENAVGFTLEFDPAQLRFEKASAIGGAALQVNTNQTAQGRVGVVLAKSVGQTFGTGIIPVAHAQFTPVGNLGEVGLSLGDMPVVREIASTAAEVLPAVFEDGTLRVIQSGRLDTQVHLTGGVAELLFTGQEGESYRIEASTDLQHWSLLSVETPGAGPMVVRDTAAGQFRQRFYRAVPEP